MTRKCRGCGQVHATPHVIQAIPQPSVESRDFPRGAATAIVVAFIIGIALLNDLVPAIVRVLGV